MHFATMLTSCALFVLAVNCPVFPHLPKHLCLGPMPLQLRFVTRILQIIFLIIVAYPSDAQLLVFAQEKQLGSLCRKKVESGKHAHAVGRYEVATGCRRPKISGHLRERALVHLSPFP